MPPELLLLPDLAAPLAALKLPDAMLDLEGLEGLHQGPAKCQRTALRRHASFREGGRQAAGKPPPAPRALARSATFDVGRSSGPALLPSRDARTELTAEVPWVELEDIADGGGRELPAAAAASPLDFDVFDVLLRDLPRPFAGDLPPPRAEPLPGTTQRGDATTPIPIPAAPGGPDGMEMEMSLGLAPVTEAGLPPLPSLGVPPGGGEAPPRPAAEAAEAAAKAGLQPIWDPYDPALDRQGMGTLRIASLGRAVKHKTLESAFLAAQALFRLDAARKGALAPGPAHGYGYGGACDAHGRLVWEQFTVRPLERPDAGGRLLEEQLQGGPPGTAAALRALFEEGSYAMRGFFIHAALAMGWDDRQVTLFTRIVQQEDTAEIQLVRQIDPALIDRTAPTDQGLFTLTYVKDKATGLHMLNTEGQLRWSFRTLREEYQIVLNVTNSDVTAPYVAPSPLGTSDDVTTTSDEKSVDEKSDDEAGGGGGDDGEWTPKGTRKGKKGKR